MTPSRSVLLWASHNGWLGAHVPAWPFDVFLRPPQQVSTIADAAVYQSPKPHLRLFRYKGNADGTYSFFLAAALIGEACSLRRVSTTGLILSGPSVTDDMLSKTLAQLRPWSLMLVIASAEEYIADMLTALRA